MSTEQTFEKLNEHFENVNLSDYQKGGKSVLNGDDIARIPGDVRSKLCGIYKMVKPLIDWLADLSILPKKWRDVVKTFKAIMDAICP